MGERMWGKMNWNELSKFRSQIYGIAMVWIVIYHVWESYPEQMTFPWTLSEIVSYGNIGVDIFLFLSGISMYFAVQKEIRDGGFLCIRKFYYKRISKIAIVYVLFCVPYFVFMHLIWNYDLSLFLKQLFFCREKISSFWFLLCIVVCYLLYPFIY